MFYPSDSGLWRDGMDIVAQIEQLAQRRKALENEIASIDTQMSRVRVALGIQGPKPKSPDARNPEAYHRRAYPGQGGPVPDAVLAALAEQEPQNMASLAAKVGVSIPWLNTCVLALMAEQKVFRRPAPEVRTAGPGRKGGMPFVYARTREALGLAPVNGNGHVAPEPPAQSEQPSAEAADELG